MQTILIVEDETGIVRLLASLFEDEGYAVLVAGNGQEALTLLVGARPALILSDVMMPVMDGVELCRRLNAHPAYSLIPLVLMSSQYKPTLPDGCSCTAFVRKPFGIDALLEIVGQAITHSPLDYDPGHSAQYTGLFDW